MKWTDHQTFLCTVLAQGRRQTLHNIEVTQFLLVIFGSRANLLLLLVQ